MNTPNRNADQREQEMAALLRQNAELQRRVAEQSEALKQADSELQSLSYAISHDLRAPLRAISGFSRIVLSSGSEKLDAEGIDNLGRIVAGAERMGRLIDDLLRLSRVSRQEMHPQTVDFSQLAGEVAGSLRQAHPQRQVEVSIAPDIMVTADRSLLQILLENLVGNAWKFTACGAAAKIDIGQFESDGELACFVRDNGVGFDMRYAGKLFGAFQRLHSSREFEGTGIGLAIARRIVIKHGGRIWAEAAPKQGAAFYFTLAQGAQALA